MEGRDLNLCPDSLGISAELVTNTLGCQRVSPSPRACVSSSTCAGGAGMLQGWYPGMPSRVREGHLLCQSLEHQHLAYSLCSPGITPQLWHRGHLVHFSLCAVVSCEQRGLPTFQEELQHLFASPNPWFVALLCTPPIFIVVCAGYHGWIWDPHWLGSVGFLNSTIHKWLPWIFVCGQSSVSLWSLERLVENNWATAISVLHLNRGICCLSGEVKYFSGLFLAYHSKSWTK